MKKILVAVVLSFGLFNLNATDKNTAVVMLCPKPFETIQQAEGGELVRCEDGALLFFYKDSYGAFKVIKAAK